MKEPSVVTPVKNDSTVTVYCVYATRKLTEQEALGCVKAYMANTKKKIMPGSTIDIISTF